MRFHGLMLLRDEEDVIAQTLDHLLGWIDSLHILDMGSTDATWDIVQDYARRDKRVVPFLHEPIVYSDNMRCMLFDQYREKFEPGDWCMKIDADEAYHVPPPKFVRERVGRLESAIHLQWYFFRLTAAEVADYESGRVDTMKDRLRPVAERRRYYKISTYAEPRMFKFRRSMQWPETVSFPYNAGFVARERIPIRHYPHRDPAQMQRRCALRATVMRLNPKATGDHWKLQDWRKEIVDERGVSGAAAAGEKVGLTGENGIDTGQLLYWKPGAELPEVPLHNHVPPLSTRLLQRAVHPLLLPILDARRRRYDKNYFPQRIPDEIQADCRAVNGAAVGLSV